MNDPFTIISELVRKLVELQATGALRFLLIGGYGLEGHSVVRDTRDIDFLIATEALPDVEKILFDLAFQRDSLTKLCGNYVHVLDKVIPVDVMLVDRPTMDKLWSDKTPYNFFGNEVFVPSVKSYIALKLHALKWNPKRIAKDGPDIVNLMAARPDEMSMEELAQMCERFGTAETFELLKAMIR
jgi:predicted nucleotidyltransferase